MQEYRDKIIQGDCLEILKTLPDEFIDCIVTSPPYFALRDYGIKGQIGLEKNHDEYIKKLCNIFDEAKRILKPEGTCWINIGDTYAGSGKGYGDKNNDPKTVRGERPRTIKKRDNGKLTDKSLYLIPARFAIEMTNRGWILRNEIIWHKPNCMPQSVKDRFTVDFEKIFLFVKSKKYYFEQQFEKSKDTDDDIRRIMKAKEYNKNRQGGNSSFEQKHRDYEKTKIRIEQGRNKRSVWTINTKPFKEAHFAVFPPEIPENCIKAGSKEGGIILDIFMGSGTTGEAAKKLGRDYLGIELNPEYIKIAEKRIREATKQQKLF
jgi:site-specific DNA-methyltransferase (adenine-specific)